VKAVIPVAGIGSRLRPHTHTQPKSLVPVAGNTILGHIIDRLLGAGLTDFVFIVGYLGDKIVSYVRRTYPDLQATFVVQEPREGLGHALWLAREEFRHDPDGVLILLGDTIVDVDLPGLMATPGSVLAVKEVKTPSMFGLVETGANGRVTKVVEKPKIRSRTTPWWASTSWRTPRSWPRPWSGCAKPTCAPTASSSSPTR
jgi:glucose-1-phosphate thymidylyltransferase